MEAVEVDSQRYPPHPLDSFALELTCDEIGRRQCGIDQPAEVADVAPGEPAGPAPNRSRSRRPGRNDPRKVAVVEPDSGHIESPGGKVHQPRGAPGTANLDEIGTLVSHDAAGRPRGEHETIRLLRRYGRAVELITTDPIRL